MESDRTHDTPSLSRRIPAPRPPGGKAGASGATLRQIGGRTIARPGSYGRRRCGVHTGMARNRGGSRGPAAATLPSCPKGSPVSHSSLHRWCLHVPGDEEVPVYARDNSGEGLGSGPSQAAVAPDRRGYGPPGPAVRGLVGPRTVQLSSAARARSSGAASSPSPSRAERSMRFRVMRMDSHPIRPRAMLVIPATKRATQTAMCVFATRRST